MLVRQEDLKAKPDLVLWCDEVFGRVLSRQRVDSTGKYEHLSQQQIDTIKAMYEPGCRNIIKGYRRCGLTTMMLLVAAYKLIFDGETNILYATSSTRAGKSASDLLLNILHACDQYIVLLPSKNLNFEFDVLGEKKRISFVPESQFNHLVGNRYTDGFFDDYAFYMDKRWRTDIDSIFGDAGVNIGSCPNGEDDCFWRLFNDAMEGKNNFNILTMQWFLEDRFSTGLRFVNKEGKVVKNIKPTKGNICEFLSRGYGITSDQREQMSQYMTSNEVAREIDGQF